MAANSRRTFLKTTTAGVALAALPHVHAAGGDTLRVGLIGCGGRGTGAAGQALRADPNVKLVALGDVFKDRLAGCLDTLKNDAKIAGKLDVTPERQFVGFDAYKDVIAASDVVLLCTPPHFRPAHLDAAVKAGKHVFAEKPVAVDAPGVRAVLETCKLARQKNLSIVSGLCLRYDNGFRATVKRIHDGAVGDIVALQANDYRSSNWAKKREDGWDDLQYQMRNWYNFTWLSGDFNVEQHVHYLDVCAWLMNNQYPAKAMGLGGQQVRTGPEYGNIFDHFAIVYEYDNGVRFYSNTRQQKKCKNDMSAVVLGSKGRALLSERTNGLQIKTVQEDWVYDGPANEMYQTEHDELFASIRKGKPLDNADYMTRSTLLAIMGRMAAYTGQLITWDMAFNSKENLSPKSYQWGPNPVPGVAMPGVTRFI